MAKNLTPSNHVAPTIHLNGSSGDELEATLNTAIAAIEAATNALFECYPHGRDYYPQSDEAYVWARDQHNTRVNKLVKVQTELEEIVKNVQRQNTDIRHQKKTK